MTRCPISYEPCDRGRYASAGLKLLSPKLGALRPFPYSQGEALQKASEQKQKMSISGAQPKLGAQLSLKNEGFEITAKGGAFILKPNSPNFVEVPANEATTMRIAAMAGIRTPLSGMLYDKDGGFIYFVKRFDRSGRKKRAQEDFGQLLGLERAAKYAASTEDLARAVREYASFPALEMPRLYRLVLFNFLVGNEDAHVKNFSLLTDRKGVARLSPAYDLVNTSVVYPDGKLPDDETALSLRGRKRGLNREDFEQHLAGEVMGLKEGTAGAIRADLDTALRAAADFIHTRSFLSFRARMLYLFVLGMRRLRFGLTVPPPSGEHAGDLHLEETNGLAYARLSVRGFNLVFSPTPNLEPYDGAMVTITRANGETTIRRA